MVPQHLLLLLINYWSEEKRREEKRREEKRRSKQPERIGQLL
jgi:hypothetical protein